MNRFKKVIGNIMASIFFLALILNFNACSEQSPMSSETESIAVTNNLNILKLGNSKSAFSLNKIVSVSQWVTKKNGGELIVDYKGYEHNNGDVEVKVTLKVFAETISQDSELALSLDDQEISGNVALSFSPHGVTFSSPALLNIEAKNLDLSGVNPADINIYYDNQETGQWEVMESDKVIVKVNDGYVKIINGQLPHFSRYAIGME